MNEKQVARQIRKIARKILALYDEFDQKDVADSYAEIQSYVNSVDDHIENFKKKQSSLIANLEKKLESVRKVAMQDAANSRKAEAEFKNIMGKIDTKRYYQDEPVPEAEDYKNYTSQNERYIDGIMRQGGINDAFTCVANAISRQHDLTKMLDKFQTGYITPLKNGAQLRTSIGKQSSNRELLREFAQASKNRDRMKVFLEKLEVLTRNIMVDLIDGQGRILAHASVTAAALRDFRKSKKYPNDYEFPEDENVADYTDEYYHNYRGSSKHNAGFLQDFFKGIKNTLSKIGQATTNALKSIKGLFIKAKSFEDNNDVLIDNIFNELQGQVDFLEKLND